MNDLGMTFAWCAIQATLMLIPATILHAVVSRRSAISGSWTATVGLGLSLAIGVSTLIPRPRRVVASHAAAVTLGVSAETSHSNRQKNSPGPIREGVRSLENPGRLAVNLSRAFDEFLGVWRRLRPTTNLPVARFRPWGGALAVAVIAGVAFGLFRLVLGLAAVEYVAGAGTIVTDSTLIGLYNELQLAMGCRQAVEIREVPDLTAPATAGWRHPVIMLPDDWMSWNDADRRAVLAHETRSHQSLGLRRRALRPARAGTQFYQPLVHWLAARLSLQQELAADAIGARFAGGGELYLLSLSRLALTQDGRSPSWPTRAFLPARGTLIRRIAMLQDKSKNVDRPWSRSGRLLSGLFLLAAALGVAMLRGPARGDENEKTRDAIKTAAPFTGDAANPDATPFDLRNVSEEMEAMIAFRPSATFRRTGMPLFTTLSDIIDVDLSAVA